MQPQQSSRVDLVELKAQIVKKVGVERFKKYFYYLNRFLSQKLNKSDFDKSCFRLLGRENLPLHNQLICSILKNASLAKTAPPPVSSAGPTKSSKSLGEDGFEQSGSLLPNQNVSVWSNGVLPMSPRKARSGIRDRRPRDRPSPLGPTGKVVTDNGEMPPCDYQRPVQPSDSESSAQWLDHLSSSGGPLIAPLGIPFCSASIGGSRKAQPVATSSGLFSFYDCGGLYDSERLRKRMEQIAALQGIGGVSMECANTLNNMLDVYLKRLIKSCVELVRKPQIQKQPVQGKIINGIVPANSGTADVMHEQRPRCSISLLDFKVAMELNPQQIGEDWPLLLEKISVQAFDN